MNQSSIGMLAPPGRAADVASTYEHAGRSATQPTGAARNEGPAARVSISREAGQVAAIKEYVRQLFEQQGLELNGEFWNEMSVADAQAAIADGGEWSSEAVADRIIGFVSDIGGGNPELKERLQEAVRQGFEEARQALGGWLPEVSERTFELVMGRFDEAFQEVESAVANPRV
jgi:hypothetical protein